MARKRTASRGVSSQDHCSESDLPAPTEEYIQATVLACREFAQAGYTDEVERFLVALPPSAERAASTDERIEQGLRSAQQVSNWDEARRSDPVKWMMSVLWWKRCRTFGKKEALKGLPFLIELDCAFFLRQRWIAELLAQWREKSETSKVKQVFFGTGKSGVRSFETARSNEKRDLKVCVAIQKLRSKGRLLSDAFCIVASDSLKVAGERLSTANVRRIYEQRRRGDTPLLHLLAPK